MATENDWGAFFNRLSLRARRVLAKNKIQNFDHLEKTHQWELLRSPNCGPGTVEEIRRVMRGVDRYWAGDKPAGDKPDDAGTIKLNLRMTEALRARLEAEAKRRRVSMNALILSHLEHLLLMGDIKSAVHEALNEAGLIRGFNERQASSPFPRGNEAVNPYVR